MTILTADVAKVKCLFFSKLLELINSENYGVTCDETTSLTILKKIKKHIDYGCYSDDYIRNLVLDEGDDITECDRYTQESGVPI